MAPVPDSRFAAAIAGFGQLLHGSAYLGSWSWYDAIALASSGCGPDPFGYRAEAVQLMRLAANLSVAAQYPVEPFLDGHIAWHSRSYFAGGRWLRCSTTPMDQPFSTSR